ncbi:hypothetical protein B0H17DRAFT_1191219 [Mycena rosella]|uniref:Arrestin-like N-terminal domain-containing protein n=1 Tax=Mycena rosella TaxID=1033263 RepID=A0AAD7GZU4_MYCRO|nr:hypothetical protein B0H17DRAFT_1191219 [Mycena rosella]
MSLLRDILKKKKGSAADKRDTASVKSSGARSLVASLYSLTIGGQRVKKRRRPDFSSLGAPEWYHEDPPQPVDMPGTVSRTDLCAYTIAHGTVLPLRIEEKNHWLSVILFNHASESSLAAMYHNEAKVTGQVRLYLEKTKSISSIDVWLAAIAPTGQIISLTANVWNRQKGNPRLTDAQPTLFKGKFPEGTYVFPFELPPLPKFVPVTHPDNDTRKTKGLVPLPPSGKISYTCGVGVRRDSVNGIDEDMDMILQYIPLTRPLPQPATPFPFLASREDWPLKHESLGGWVLSPFGGRGRIGTEIVEVEGILGVRDPAVYTAGQTLEFTVLLWSKSAVALKLLGQPAAVSVEYYKGDYMPSSEALRPREQSRQTRTLERIGEGRAWIADTGRPRPGEPAPQLVSLDLPEAGTPPADLHPPKTKPAAGSRMQSWTAEDGPADEHATESTTVEGDADAVEPPSPSHSAEDFTDDLDMQDTDHFQRLDGELRIPPCRPVSYRYTQIGREYSLQLHIEHPQYAHISPTGPGLLAEVPIWYVADRALPGGPAALNDDPTYLATLPLKGATIPVGEGTIWWPKTIGEVATQGRGGKPKIGQSFIGLIPPTRDSS